MAKIRFKKINTRNPLLFSTSVENLFISELLPAAPGEYVKVYLFGLMNAGFGGAEDIKVTSNVLNMPVEDIEKAWAYWEDKGAVQQVYDPETRSYRIDFISQIEEIFGTPMEEAKPAKTASVSPEAAPQDAPEASVSKTPEQLMAEEVARLEDLEIRALYTNLEEAKGTPISTQEANKIRDTINIYGVTPDVYSYAIQYCSELDKYSVDYISKVAIRWTEEGCHDIAQVKALLDSESKRTSEYHRIFREVGFKRTPSPADREMMDTWLDSWGFKMSEILDACRTTAGMREPSLRYVNRVLENKMKEAGGIDTKKSSRASANNSEKGDSYQKTVSRRVLGAYYDYIRNQSELEYQEHLDEARKIPQMADILKLESELNKAMMTIEFGSNIKEKKKIQMEKRNKLEKKKRELLLQSGYPEDYLEKKYRCEKCRDTGITDDGQFCSCKRQRIEEAYEWNLKKNR